MAGYLPLRTEYVRTRLGTLTTHGLVSVGNGFYSLTEDGERYLADAYQKPKEFGR